MDNARFFVPVDPWQKAFVIFGLFYILPCMLYLPEYLPSPAYTGYFGNFLLYLREHHYGLVELLFFGSVLIHLLEASCALVFCIYLEVDAPTTARWVWSAALYGGFSLVHLVRRLYQDEMDREPSKEKVDWHKLE